MRKAMVIFLLGMVLAASNAYSTQASDVLIQSAQRFIDLLNKGDYEKAVADFDSQMKKACAPDQLAAIWNSLVDQFGSFVEQGEIKQLPNQGGYDILIVTCRFSKAACGLKLVYNQARKLSGFFIESVTPSSSGEYKSPAYVNSGAFSEKEVVVGTGRWAVHGTLTLPKSPGLSPAVVLVHGSGPNDRDETLGPNKPFRDIAEGLSSQGIAVLRYEKRTKEHQQAMIAVSADITVKEETLDDALAGVSLMRAAKEIDPKRIFVLGHSLGGMLIPRLGMLDPDIAGFIVMAGLVRPLEDVLLDQIKYILSLKGELSESDREQIRLLQEQADKLKKLSSTVTFPASELPFGVSPKYWLDLKGYNPAQAAKQLKQPMLILQGGRDYQVTLDDFKEWQKELSSRDNVQFQLYPKLNHLFIESEGRSRPSEYDRPGHISSAVIADIVSWIKKQ
jgi:hypothetical protein